MAWGSDTASTQLTTITTEQFFSQTPQLNPGETAHCQVAVDFPTTPTDNAIVSVYATLDDSSEDWDEIPYMSFVIDNSEDTSDVSFLVSGVYKFRVGVKQDTGTTNLTSADMNHRVNGIDL
jgi:hypothetical protein